MFDAAVEKAYGGKKQADVEGSAGRRKSLQANSTTGCRPKPWTPSANTWWASRARSPRPSAAASAR
ncbi:MAG: hypothetical protein WKG07_42420 [Hymenobacter sp.]